MGLSKYTALFLFLAGGLRVAGATFGDLAVLLAKGYFGSYVEKDASMAQCAAFLNSRGVKFSLFDLMDPDKAVTKEDLSRVVGQSEMLFSGEAEVVDGEIKKPLDVETWVDYCLLNDIDSTVVWNRFVQRTADGSLPEVVKFFRK